MQHYYTTTTRIFKKLQACECAVTIFFIKYYYFCLLHFNYSYNIIIINLTKHY